MKITVYPPQGFSIQGQRDYNEDYLYPELDAISYGRLFLVCDGVGGSSRGEVASQLACSCFAQLLEPDLQEEDLQLDALHLEQLLKATEQQMSYYLEEHPEAEGMATTLTLLALHGGGATVGHIGDSRVYQFRNGEIIFQTKDHSFVQDLLDEGLIDEERAKVHPKRNVISRALQGAEQPTKISTSVLTDIQADDYFLLCSDGVLEAWDNEALKNLFSESEEPEDLTTTLLEGCEARSKDNATAYVLQVEEVEGAPADWALAAQGSSSAALEQEELTLLEEENEAEDVFAETDEEIASSSNPPPESESNNKLLFSILLLGALGLALFWWQPWTSAKAKPDKVTTAPSEKTPVISERNDAPISEPTPVESNSPQDWQMKQDTANGKWGFWDKRLGDWQIRAQYDTILEGFNGERPTALVTRKGQKLRIDVAGKRIEDEKE